MNKKILVTAFLTYCIATLVGIYLRAIHAVPFEMYLVNLVAFLFFLVTFIVEVRKSTHVNSRERFMWIIGFVFLGWMAAFIYLIKFRRFIGNP